MSGPNGDPNISAEEGIINDEDEFEEEEYEAINSMLDQINTYLDDLEERNDSLNGKLHELMESNRQARMEFRAQLLGSQNEEGQCPADGDNSSTSKEDQSKDGGDWAQQNTEMEIFMKADSTSNLCLLDWWPSTCIVHVYPMLWIYLHHQGDVCKTVIFCSSSITELHLGFLLLLNCSVPMFGIYRPLAASYRSYLGRYGEI